ncbi:HAD domain-containing protein [Kocuria oxytropis]|uniref:HAD domain-containing protein n=1 Tax=Kocuria oxytropis TaxID=3058913 RepID=UPI0034D4FD11
MVSLSELPDPIGDPSPRVVILLDVDGVLNPKVVRDPSATGNTHRLVLSPSRAEVVRDLGSLGPIVWATTWERGALHQLSTDLGINMAGHVPMTRLDPDRRTPKLPAVQRWISRMQATGDLTWDLLVWIDDNLGPDTDAWAAEQGNPTFLVRTDPRYGVRSSDAHAIRQWSAAFKP